MDPLSKFDVVRWSNDGTIHVAYGEAITIRGVTRERVVETHTHEITWILRKELEVVDNFNSIMARRGNGNTQVHGTR